MHAHAMCKTHAHASCKLMPMTPALMHMHTYPHAHASLMYHASQPSETSASLHPTHPAEEVTACLQSLNPCYLQECISHSKLLPILMMYLHARQNHMEDIPSYKTQHSPSYHLWISKWTCSIGLKSKDQWFKYIPLAPMK